MGAMARIKALVRPKARLQPRACAGLFPSGQATVWNASTGLMGRRRAELREQAGQGGSQSQAHTPALADWQEARAALSFG